MISEVLSEAVQEIERQQRDEPDTYGELEREIDAVKLAMSRLVQFLDVPPTREVHVYREALTALVQAIERADEEWPEAAE